MRESIFSSARQIGLTAEEIQKLEVFFQELDSGYGLAAHFRHFSSALSQNPRQGFRELRERELENDFSREPLWTFYFILALSQIPTATSRRLALGYDSELATGIYSDMAMRMRLSQNKTGQFGVPIEVLEWFQEYLADDLVRIGQMQFKRTRFPRNVRIFRELGGARGWMGVDVSDIDNPRPLDLTTGIVKNEPLRCDDARNWEGVLSPDDYVIKMHLPQDAELTPDSLRQSIRAAYAYFSRLFGPDSFRGFYGESWFLDPLLWPTIKNPELHFIIGLGPIFPSVITELNTIKRLFGYDETRESILRDATRSRTTLQDFIRDHLADPAHALNAKGIFASHGRLAELGIHNRPGSFL